jgi:hypothetical protein
MGRNAKRRREATAAARGKFSRADQTRFEPPVGAKITKKALGRGRSYDRELINRKASLGYRVLEEQPFCWMCRRTTGKRAREHIFAGSLLEQLGAASELFEPTHIDLMGRVISKRGPFPASALLSGEICDACNNGWMRRLEEQFLKVFLRDPAQAWTREEQQTVAHWFAKTAIVINVSQNYRLLVPQAERHAAEMGVPPGFEVFVAKTKDHRTHLDFKQGWNMGGWVIPTDQVERRMALAERCYRCAIRIDDLVGVVLYAPPDNWLEPQEAFTSIWPSARDLLSREDLAQVGWTDDYWLRPRDLRTG